MDQKNTKLTNKCLRILNNRQLAHTPESSVNIYNIFDPDFPFFGSGRTFKIAIKLIFFSFF